MAHNNDEPCGTSFYLFMISPKAVLSHFSGHYLLKCILREKLLLLVVFFFFNLLDQHVPKCSCLLNVAKMVIISHNNAIGIGNC